MLILASASPQRKAILKALKLKFRSIPANINEQDIERKFNRPHAIVKNLALQKARKIAKDHPNQWILGADTLVFSSEGALFSKPESEKEAREMLFSYQNHFCDVYSGIALVNQSMNKFFVQYDKTRISFKNFSEASLENYLKKGEWRLCSGGLKIEKSEKWIREIKGDYWNVVGLPVNKLKEMLRCI